MAEIVILKATAERLEDGTLKIRAASDVFEQWMQTKAVKNAAGDDFKKTAANVGLRAYQLDAVTDRKIGDYISPYMRGWGEFAMSMDYSPQILKAIGLKDGIEAILPLINGGTPWNQANTDYWLSTLNTAANKLYRNMLAPVKGEITITVVDGNEE